MRGRLGEAAQAVRPAALGATLFRPAIYFAENGFPVTEMIQRAWRCRQPKLRRRCQRARPFSCRGARARRGRGLPQSATGARRCKLIAGEGAEAFYRGPDRQTRSRDVGAARAGRCRPPTWPSSQAEWVTPISTNYRGWKVYELPPNGQGIAALEMLNIMETLPAGRSWGPRAPRRCT